MACSRCGRNKPITTPNPARNGNGQVYHPTTQPSNVTASTSAQAVRNAIQGLKYVPSGKQ